MKKNSTDLQESSVMQEKKQIVLSISLLVSGRKETRKCLDSLKPFMEQLACELILVDTGCDKDTRAIIEEYTDQIIPFTWCADFSKARNVGLEHAVGEWFLYLDDDEWFGDVSEIIDFFKSGEYKDYCSACYIQRNYSNYEGTSYMDANVSRMIKLEKETRFVSSIHEYLAPYKAPVKLFDTYVNHYGYIFASNKARFEHSKRNVELLIDMMKKEPMQFRWDTQMLQEYMGIGEYDKVIEVAQKAISKYHKIKQKDSNKCRELGTFYGYLAEAYDRKYDYVREKECLESAFQEKDLTKLAQAYLYKCAVMMHYQQENYEKCTRAFEKYMQIYKKIGTDKDAIYQQGGMLVGDAFQKRIYEDMLLHGMMASVKIGREDLLEEYFHQLGWKDVMMLLHPDFMPIVITHMAETEFRVSYIQMAKTMSERVNNIGGVIPVLQKIERDYRNCNDSEQNKIESENDSISLSKEKTKKQFERIVRIFSEVNHNHWYITYLKILYARHQGKEEEILPLYDKLFLHVFDIFNLDIEIWKIAEEHELEMEPFFLRIDFDIWRNGICQWIQYGSEEDFDYKEKQVRKWKKTENIRYDFLFMKVKEGYLRHFKKETEDFLSLEEKIFDFAHKEIEFYKNYYKEEVFKECQEMLPQECRIAVRLLEVEEERLKGDDKQVVEKMKQLLNCYPPLNETIKWYIEKFSGFIKEKDKRTLEARSELSELMDALKWRAELYFKEEKYIEAKTILEELIKYASEDKEIKELLKKTNQKFQ